jgi:uncharacterized protein
MESIIKFEKRPKLEHPIFIEGLPGVGNVGKIAADHVAEKLGAERFAVIYSKHLPPQVLLDEQCLVTMCRNELWFAKGVGTKKKDVIILRGEYQGSTPEGQFEMTRDILEAAVEMDISKIITMGGYATGTMIDEPRILGAVNDLSMKVEFEDYGVVFVPREPEAGIVGASGLLLGLGALYGIPGICLMGETSGFFLDHKSAMSSARVLEKALGVEIDMKELEVKSEQIDELTAKVKEYEEDQDSADNLNYIG